VFNGAFEQLQYIICTFQVQQEVSSRRQKEKKEMIEAVKKFRKG